MAAFRPVVVGLRDRNGDGVTNEADVSPEDQFGVEVVLLRWTGETVIFQTLSSSGYAVDRWAPIPDLKTDRLPPGMSVAVPTYFNFGDNFGDDSWVSPTDFTVQPISYQGEVPAIMFDETGASLEDNPNSPALGPWLDWNDDRVVRTNGQSRSANEFGVYSIPETTGGFYRQARFDDEPFASVSSFLAIFDHADARAQLAPGQDFENGVLSGGGANASYVQQQGKILHLNRFSGVVMK